LIKPFINILIYLIWVKQKDMIRLKCEAKLKGRFYVDPEAKFLFIIIVIDPKLRIILQLLCLRPVTFRLMFFIIQQIGLIFELSIF
jgi:hypothetical protein